MNSHRAVTNELPTHRSLPPRITQLVPIAGALRASAGHDDHKGHEDEDTVPEDTALEPAATMNEKYWGKSSA
jgi:hypothetical protein